MTETVAVPALVQLVERRHLFQLEYYQLLGFVHQPTGEQYDPFVEGWRPGIHSGRLKFVAFGGFVTSEGSSCEVSELNEDGFVGFLFSIHTAHRIRVNWGGKAPIRNEAVRVANVVEWIRECGARSVSASAEAAMLFAAQRAKKRGHMLTAAAFDIEFIDEEALGQERARIVDGQSQKLWFDRGPIVGVFDEAALQMQVLARKGRRKEELLELARATFAELLLGEFDADPIARNGLWPGVTQR